MKKRIVLFYRHHVYRIFNSIAPSVDTITALSISEKINEIYEENITISDCNLLSVVCLCANGGEAVLHLSYHHLLRKFEE